MSKNHILTNYLNSLERLGSIKRNLWTCPSQLAKSDPFKEDKLPVYDYGKVHAERKRLYVFGCSMHGGLGLEALLRPKGRRVNPKLYMDHPVRHKFAHKYYIADVATGHGFTIIGLKRKHQNYPIMLGCGLNDNSQLGYQSVRKSAPLEQLIGLVNISLPVKADRPKILALAAGRAHVVASIKDEGLITWGNNESGQCGRLIIDSEQYFGSKYVHRIPEFGKTEESEIVKIASRYDFNACLTADGKVFTFGDNRKGQLGRGNKIWKTWELATPVQGDIKDEKIVDISTNGTTVLAVSEKGELFGWGCNELGLLSASLTRTLHYEPKHIAQEKKVNKIVSCSVGDMCAYIVNKKGNVYVWGQGPTLGLGPSLDVVRIPTIIPPPLFGRNEFNPECKVTNIVGGFYHSAAITSTGEVFTWGINQYGCLGLGISRDTKQSFPLRVSLGGRAFKVSLGVDHTVVVTSGGI